MNITRRHLAIAALVCVPVSVSAVAWVDAKNPQWDPVDLAFSRFVHGTHGWLVIVAIMVAALASVFALLAMWPAISRRGVQAPRVVLSVAVVALVIAACVPADPPGVVWSWSEVVHGLAGWVAFLSVVPLVWMLRGRLRCGRGALTVLAGVSTVGTAALVLVWWGQIDDGDSWGFAHHRSSLGLVERITFVANLLAVSGASVLSTSCPSVSEDVPG